jgi:hypothetical protein
MKTFIIFDNGGNTLDRYRIINKATGDVFGCSENPESADGKGKFVGNCAEIETYINNARLDPDWIGKEADLILLPIAVRRWVAQLASCGRPGTNSPASIVYMTGSTRDAPAASGG